MKSVLILSVFLLLNFSGHAHAQSSLKEHLTGEEISRIKSLRDVFYETEKKTPQQIVEEIEKTPYPKVNLAIKEAMAHSYVEIVREQNVQDKHKKEWLYSMIALNMAYFQFGGDKDSAGGTKNLNRLIRSKLKIHLPSGIFNQPGFHCSLG